MYMSNHGPPRLECARIAAALQTGEVVWGKVRIGGRDL